MSILSPVLLDTDTIKAELAELRPYLSCESPDGQAPEELWQKYFPTVSPRQMLLSLPADIASKKPKMDITFYNDIDFETGARIEINTENSYKLRVLTSNPDLPEKPYVTLDFCHVLPKAGKQSHATKLLHWMGQLAVNLGVEEARTYATDENGGYTWAKFGFAPDPEYWKALQGALTKAITGKHVDLSKLEDSTYAKEFPDGRFTLTPDEAQRLDKIINPTNPRDDVSENLWIISDLDRVLKEIPRQDENGNELPPFLLTVGKALLCGQSWEGSLSLEEGSPGWERFTSYISRSPNQSIEAMTRSAR